MRLRYSAQVMTLATVIQILGYAYALPGHIGDPTWSAHAQFHLFLSWLWLIGLNIGIMALAWGPLQKRDRGSFWVLLLLFLLAQGGHYITSLVVPAGRPSEWWYDYALGVNVVIFALGLAFAWKALANRDSA